MARLLNPNPTRYDLTIGERGAMRLPTQPRGMTYHHIIPFPELRAFWNTAVACDLEPLRETLVPELIRSMTEYPLKPAISRRMRRHLLPVQRGCSG